ncbi:hypothetical protein EXIGLDRAFT_719052 [Exidia glandulosa HHB12029]|uniref:Uncharacterized protein n=1 Tax=Exidia glandulosa HHB12029 TaxID=1314781 RepID=A0A165HC64_EXIGL|nr:hypothetical protein EXIGLDRAFT_719052 [Exidia glandulosa HHB12029]
MTIVFLRALPVPSTRTGSDSSPESSSRGVSAAPFCTAEPDALSPALALFAGTSSSGPSARRFACVDGVAGPDPLGGAALPAREGTALPARDGGAL